ncbi:3'-5' exonuclease [Streptomyces boncukensis]|uniref:3'-5' exonuclease n=1 Tax=Streptomyces boncukensis TaxID=2711219 RepID=A0A6G4WRZ1_9ACTN|nr:3'-5' exonuclease [Streptomyces boncukensis]NGO68036.1 3'-5' exonuclease [Streptomyces boncukensis]
MTLWYESPLAAFALRSRRSGPPGSRGDAALDRIAAAALVTQQAPGAPPTARRWVVPAGHRRAAALDVQARALAAQESAGTPLVVPNAPYDLTLLDRELDREHGARLADYLGGASLCVLDPVVLDRRLDRARHCRTLPELCRRYGVPPPEDGGGEVTAACAALAVVRALGRHHAPRLSAVSPAELHTLQAVWYAAQARGLAAWFAREGSERPVDPAWPLRPRPPGPQGPADMAG